MHRLKYAIPRATTCFTFYAQGKYTFHTRKFMINVNELHLWILVEATWKLLLWKFNVEEFTSSFQVSYIFANALHVLCVCVCVSLFQLMHLAEQWVKLFVCHLHTFIRIKRNSLFLLFIYRIIFLHFFQSIHFNVLHMHVLLNLCTVRWWNKE